MSTKPDQYYQCKLARPGAHGGTMEMVTWIEARGAKVGAKVELLPSKLVWEVVEVGVDLPAETLAAHRQMHRKSLPSIEPMA